VLRVLFTDSATRQADEICAWGEERFGEAVHDRYDLLLAQAVIDLAEAPRRRGVEVIDGRIHYHIRHSLPSILKADRVGSARHLVIAGVVGDALWVLATPVTTWSMNATTTSAGVNTRWTDASWGTGA
jgi:plasmid stabilization system protein ParE